MYIFVLKISPNEENHQLYLEWTVFILFYFLRIILLTPEKITILETYFNLYSNFLDVDALCSELKLCFERKWVTYIDIDLPSRAIEALNNCNENLYSNINFFYQKY